MTTRHNAFYINLGLLLGLVFLVIPGYAQDYPSGHQALEVWDEAGRAGMPRAVAIWIMLMMVSFLAGFLFVWKHVEARFVVGGVLLGFLFTKVVIDALGWIPLSGLVALMHLIFWTPGLVILWMRRPFLARAKVGLPYAIWSGWITAVIMISFVFDIRDSVIYLHHLMVS